MPRVKVKYRTGSRECFEKFIKANPDVTLTFEEWKEIIYAMSHSFRDYILETGAKAKFLWGTGSWTISKKKITKKSIEKNGKVFLTAPINWQKSKAAGKIIYNFNPHTDGYRYKWLWFMSDARFPLAEIWNFKPSRETSRKLAEYLNKKDSIYAQLYRVWERKKQK